MKEKWDSYMRSTAQDARSRAESYLTENSEVLEKADSDENSPLRKRLAKLQEMREKVGTWNNPFI